MPVLTIEAFDDLLDSFAVAVAANAGHLVVGARAPADAAAARAAVVEAFAAARASPPPPERGERGGAREAEDWPGQRSELRALCAVARAARRHVTDYYDALPLGASSDPLVKALERLDRASRRGAKGE